MRSTRFVARASAVVMATALLAAGCGGGDEDGEAGEVGVAAPADEPAGVTDGEDTATGGREPDGRSGGSSDVGVPVARYVAHGPSTPNTFGPQCSTGIGESPSSMFRLTAPAAWTYRGGSGGTGPSQLVFETAEGEVLVDLYKAAEELRYEYSFEVGADAGPEIEIDGDRFPLKGVTIGERTGFALVDLPYLGPLPVAGDVEGTVTVTARDVDLSPDEIAEVLSSVRAERCAVVAEVGIWGPVAGVQLVPRFDPDPMGKPYPDQPQPVSAPGESRVNAYSVEQVAYLLPLEAGVDACVAPKAQELAAGDFLVDTLILSPVNNAKETLAALTDGC
jgi:hypothetical protein